jgi:2'-5' RNA ligase
MRLFFALWLPEEPSRKLAAEARALARRFGGRAVRQETMHLTLAFLGEVADERLPAVIEAARLVRSEPFEWLVDRLGYWRRPRLIWAGGPPARPLLALAAELRERLRAADAACDESRPFAPHLTLARKVSAAASSELPAIAPLSWPCRSFALVRSRRTEAGADYFTVAEFPFGDSRQAAAATA